MVVTASDTRSVGTVTWGAVGGSPPAPMANMALIVDSAPSVADVCEMLARNNVQVVAPAFAASAMPKTSQSPGVSEMLVTFAGTSCVAPVVVAVTIDSIYSPIFPAAALSFVVVPVITDDTAVPSALM